MMKATGLAPQEIARVLDISAKDLRTEFQRELNTGAEEAHVEVVDSLHKLATEAKNVTAATFWLKTRLGWREKPEEEHEEAVRQEIVVRVEDRKPGEK